MLSKLSRNLMFSRAQSFNLNNRIIDITDVFNLYCYKTVDNGIIVKLIIWGRVSPCYRTITPINLSWFWISWLFESFYLFSFEFWYSFPLPLWIFMLMLISSVFVFYPITILHHIIPMIVSLLVRKSSQPIILIFRVLIHQYVYLLNIYHKN